MQTNESLARFLNDNCIIVCDTNVYLNLYEYSPEAADFFVSLLELIKQKIILPDTVYREFKKNHKKSHGRQLKKLENAFKNFRGHITSFSDKTMKQFAILENLQFPDMQDFREQFQETLAAMNETLQAYLDEHDVITYINEKFLDSDKPRLFLESLLNDGALLEAFTLDEIYAICEEGEGRYKRRIPPGFEDGKDKIGLLMFNDLIIWNEIIRYCFKKGKNLLFVTDDIKPDWWTIEGVNRTGLREELITEFEKRTKQKLIGVTSKEFYSYLAWAKDKRIPSAIEWILNNDYENYINGIIETGITSDLLEKLPDAFTHELTGYDGSELDFDDDYEKCELISSEFDGYNDARAYYKLHFEFSVKAYSQEYWGRDDDTKEVILSPRKTHILKGNVDVLVTKEIDNYIDRLVNDYSYLEIEIIDLNLTDDTSFMDDDLCVECEKNIGEYSHREGGYVCVNCATTNARGEICPQCGEKVPFELMAGNGYCTRCTVESDL
jgi:rRNA-processing protein FCF1